MSKRVNAPEYNRRLITKRLYRRCRGAAPIELVMGLPFLLVVVASCYSIGKAVVGKQVATIEVRRYGWTLARDPENANASRNLVRQGWLEASSPQSAMTSLNPKSDIRLFETEKRTRIARWLGDSVRPRGRTAVVVGTWDHEDVPEMNRLAPHVFLFGKVARQGISGVSAAVQSDVRGLFQDLVNGIARTIL